MGNAILSFSFARVSEVRHILFRKFTIIYFVEMGISKALRVVFLIATKKPFVETNAEVEFVSNSRAYFNL